MISPHPFLPGQSIRDTAELLRKQLSSISTISGPVPSIVQSSNLPFQKHGLYEATGLSCRGLEGCALRTIEGCILQTVNILRQRTSVILFQGLVHMSCGFRQEIRIHLAFCHLRFIALGHMNSRLPLDEVIYRN